MIGTCWLYSLGVDAGKAAIMSSLKVQEKGAGYAHFPVEDQFGRGYDRAYFTGLLSEKLTRVETRRGDRWEWQKLPGHERNEPLDLRNYANAGFKMLDPDLQAVERRLKGLPELRQSQPAAQQQPQARRSRKSDFFDDW